MNEMEFQGVILARLGDLGEELPASLEQHGERPIWFTQQAHAAAIGLFERIPEGDMAKPDVTAILGALRALARQRSDALQAVLGNTESIQFGFHVDANFDDVLTSFEDDGFDVVGTLEDGDVLEIEP